MKDVLYHRVLQFCGQVHPIIKSESKFRQSVNEFPVDCGLWSHYKKELVYLLADKDICEFKYNINIFL